MKKYIADDIENYIIEYIYCINNYTINNEVIFKINNRYKFLFNLFDHYTIIDDENNYWNFTKEDFSNYFSTLKKIRKKKIENLNK